MNEISMNEIWINFVWVSKEKIAVNDKFTIFAYSPNNLLTQPVYIFFHLSDL